MSLEWNDVVLKDVLSEKGYIRGPFGSALKRAEMKSEGIPVYEQQNAIYDNRIFRYFIDEEKYQSLKRFTTYPDDLIISCSGTVGKVSIIKHDDPKGIISQALLTLRVNKDLILPEFLKYFFSSYEGYNSLVSRSTGSVQVNISKRAVIEEIPLKLPPLDVQQKIVYYLSLIDKKIGINEKINKNLIAIAKAKFRYSFINYEDYKGEFKDTDYGVIPETFEVYSLNEMSKNIVCGKTPSTKVESNYGEEMPFITIPDMHNNVFVINTERRLSLEGIKTQPKKTLPANSVCVSCIATAGLVSLTFEESQTNQQINSIICKDNICPYFMYLYLEELSEYIKLLGSGGSTTLNLNKNEFSKIKVAIPPQEDMDKFHRFVKPIFEKIKYNQLEIIELQNLRDTLLPKFMSGEIDVSEINCDMPPKTQENCINNFTSLQQNKLVEVII